MGIQFLLGWLKAHSLFSLAKANISLTVRIIFRTLCKTARAALFLRTISKQALQRNTTTTIQLVLNNHLSVYFVVRINIFSVHFVPNKSMLVSVKSICYLQFGYEIY